ncbi:MAG: hypothetical protein MK097_09175, partial [Dechloromonas sp.]|nr:hypothetical protein [Dechloromonas sp.]
MCVGSASIRSISTMSKRGVLSLKAMVLWVVSVEKGRDVRRFRDFYQPGTIAGGYSGFAFSDFLA